MLNHWRAVIWTPIWLVVVMQGCQLGPSPSVPDLGGTYIAHAANIQVDKQTMDEIMAAFKRAEQAVLHQDLDALMAFYSESYQHRGFTKDSMRIEWENLFHEYHDFSSTHVFSSITAESDQTPPRAQVTCTGSLWAISNASNQRVNIDSWLGEVHYLTYEHGAWRIRGHAWEPIIVRKSQIEHPPHPYF